MTKEAIKRSIDNALEYGNFLRKTLDDLTEKQNSYLICLIIEINRIKDNFNQNYPHKVITQKDVDEWMSKKSKEDCGFGNELHLSNTSSLHKWQQWLIPNNEFYLVKNLRCVRTKINHREFYNWIYDDVSEGLIFPNPLATMLPTDVAIENLPSPEKAYEWSKQFNEKKKTDE